MLNIITVSIVADAENPQVAVLEAWNIKNDRKITAYIVQTEDVFQVDKSSIDEATDLVTAWQWLKEQENGKK